MRLTMLRNKLYFRKLLVAGTGLFLCLFLVVHLSANLILLLPNEMARDLYNSYSTTLRESPFIKIVAYALYLSIILHVVYALIVTIHNRRAKPQKYVVNHSRENSTWTSQNMGVLGALILLFIIIHLANFWARIKLGIGAEVGLDVNGNLDVYDVTYTLFQNPYYVIFYSILSVPLAYHLHHGFKSAFKTFGFHHKKGLLMVAKMATLYALIMGVGFGIIPLIVYFK